MENMFMDWFVIIVYHENLLWIFWTIWSENNYGQLHRPTMQLSHIIKCLIFILQPAITRHRGGVCFLVEEHVGCGLQSAMVFFFEKCLLHKNHIQQLHNFIHMGWDGLTLLLHESHFMWVELYNCCVRLLCKNYISFFSSVSWDIQKYSRFCLSLWG